MVYKILIFIFFLILYNHLIYKLIFIKYISMNKDLKRNILIFYITGFLLQLTFTSSIWTFFLTLFHNFSYSQALFILLFSSLVSTFFEIPSWAWADRYWRKRFYILWTSLLFIDSLIWIFAKDFWLFCISGFILWIWYALSSWNIPALIHDGLEKSWNEENFKDIVANSSVYKFFARFLAAIWAWFLFTIDPLYPVILTSISVWIGLFISLFLSQPQQQLSKKNNNWLQITASLKTIKLSKYLMTIIVIFVSLWGLTNVYWFTYQPYFTELWFSIKEIWIIFAAIALLSAFWSFIIKGLQDKHTYYNLILWSLITVLISAFCYTTFNVYIAFIWFILISIQFGTLMPLAQNMIIKVAPKDQKSSILSIYNLWFVLSFTLLSLSSWTIITTIWLQHIYYIVLLLLIILFIFTITHKKEICQKSLGH